MAQRLTTKPEPHPRLRQTQPLAAFGFWHRLLEARQQGLMLPVSLRAVPRAAGAPHGGNTMACQNSLRTQITFNELWRSFKPSKGSLQLFGQLSRWQAALVRVAIGLAPDLPCSAPSCCCRGKRVTN